MAEGGNVQGNANLTDWPDHLVDNFAEQNDEVIALQSIFEGEDEERIIILSEPCQECSLYTLELIIPVKLEEDTLQIDACVPMSQPGDQTEDDCQPKPNSIDFKRSESGHNLIGSTFISHLTPLTLTVTMPHEYPSCGPPELTLTSLWLSGQQLSSLCKMLDKLWKEQKCMPILYTWIDWLENNCLRYLGVNDRFMLREIEDDDIEDTRAFPECYDIVETVNTLMRYNNKMERMVFCKTDHECEVCFMEYPGVNFYRMIQCKHYICRECMKSYCNMHVKEGSVFDLVCPDTDCKNEIPAYIIKEVLGEEEFLRWERLAFQSRFSVTLYSSSLIRMDDQLYEDIVLYVSTKDYPSRVVNIANQPTQKKAEKRAIREKSKDFQATDGVLYKDGKRVLRKNEVTSVLQSLHSGKYAGGHLGRDKTFQKVKETFYWRGMKEDVRNFVRDCDICTRVNIAPPKTAPPLNSIPVPSKVWSLVGVDIIGPLPTTKNGNKYVVAATDHFSKWSTAAAIPTKTATNVTKFLLSSICTYGPMDSIITDQGREFTNAIIDELTEELNIDHRISSAYHPQTNGQRERDNRTLKEMLTKVCNKEGDNWDNLLDSVLFAYRTSCHASTKCTPFEAMFGRKARIFKMRENIDTTAYEFTKDTLMTISETRRDLNKCISQNICKAQAKQKKYYDKRNKSHTSMEKGTIVLIKNAKKIRRFGAKLSPRWIGPYEVVESLTKGRVKLKNCSSGVTLSNIYHTTLLKRYTASTPLISMGSHQRTLPIKKKLPKRSLKSDTKQKKTNLVDGKPKTSNQSNLLTITNQQQRPKTMFSPPPLEKCKTLCKALNIKFVRRPAYKSENRHAGKPTNLHRVRGDGNCFFRAISKAISGSEVGHMKCRTSIVNYMDTKPVSVKLEKYLNLNVKSYLNDSNMKDSAVWATDAEIMGTASLLKMDIYVYAGYGRCQDGNIEYVWLRYPSSFSMSEHPKTSHGLYIQNLNNDHFDVVLEC